MLFKPTQIPQLPICLYKSDKFKTTEHATIDIATNNGELVVIITFFNGKNRFEKKFKIQEINSDVLLNRSKTGYSQKKLKECHSSIYTALAEALKYAHKERFVSNDSDVVKFFDEYKMFTVKDDSYVISKIKEKIKEEPTKEDIKNRLDYLLNKSRDRRITDEEKEELYKLTLISSLL